MSSLFKNAFVLFLSFFSTPLLLKYLGADIMGNFRLIGDWLSYVSIIEISISTIFLAKLREHLHQPDPEQSLNEVLSEAMSRYLKGLLWIWGICVLLYYPFITMSKIDSALLADSTLAYVVVSLAFLFVPLAPCRLYLEIIERSDLVNYLMSIQNLIVILLSLLFAFLNFGASGQACAFFVGCAVSYYFIWKFFREKAKEITFHWRDVFKIRKARDLSIDLKQQLRDSFLLNIFHRISLYSSNIIVASFFSAKDVVPFFLTQRLSQIALDQTTNVGNSAWASVVAKSGNMSETEIKHIFKLRFYEVTKIICLTSAAFSVPIIIWNGDFMSLWIGEEYYAGPIITILACFMSLSNSLISFWRQILNAYGKISEQVWPTVIQAIIAISSSIIFTNYLGHIGPLLGLAFTFLFYHCWQFFILFKRHFDLSVLELTMKIFPTIFFTAAFSLATYKFKHLLALQNNWMTLTLQVGLSFVAFIFGSYLILLTKSEKKIWSDRLLRLRRKH